MKARTLYIFAILFSAVCSYSDGTKDTINPWLTHVDCWHDGRIGHPVSPGDEVEMVFSIRNMTSNSLALAKSSIGIRFLDSGSLLTRNARSWGAAFMLQNTPRPTFMSADEFIFLKPGAAFLYTYKMNIPEELIGDSATNLSFRATISAIDSGQEYGLNAWTGDIEVHPITIPVLQNSARHGINQSDHNAPIKAEEGGQTYWGKQTN